MVKLTGKMGENICNRKYFPEGHSHLSLAQKSFQLQSLVELALVGNIFFIFPFTFLHFCSKKGTSLLFSNCVRGIRYSSDLHTWSNKMGRYPLWSIREASLQTKTCQSRQQQTANVQIGAVHKSDRDRQVKIKVNWKIRLKVLRNWKQGCC